MSTEAVARRYARAIFELARDEGSLGAVTRELRAFADAYEASADLRSIETLPSMTDDAREAVIAQLGKKLSASDLTVRSVSLLVRRQRLSVLPDLVRQLDEMADDHLGILRAEVRAATKLDKAYLDRLKAKIEKSTGRKVMITFEQDEDLIAGIVTTIGDVVVDGSLRGKLNQLSATLRQG